MHGLYQYLYSRILYPFMTGVLYMQDKEYVLSPWVDHKVGLQTINASPPLRLRELLTTMGDRLTDEEVDLMLRGAPVDSSGMFDYNAFTRILKHGTKDD